MKGLRHQIAKISEIIFTNLQYWQQEISTQQD